MTRKFWFVCARVQVCFCEFVYLRFERKKHTSSLGFCELVYLCIEKNITHKFSFCELVYLCIKNNNPQVWLR